MVRNAIPSASFVDESSRAVCTSLKAICKQIFMLNVSYQRKTFRKSGKTISRTLSEVVACMSDMQDSLTAAAKEMKFEIEASETDDHTRSIPEEVVISGKEYAFLNSVFREYTKDVMSTPESSDGFSLFSRTSVDPFPLEPCLQDSAMKSNDS